MRRLSTLLLASAASLWLSSCGSQTPAAPLGWAALALDADCERLGSDLVGHSCLHAAAGPFDTVVAGSSESEASSVPNINRAHTFYTVELPEGVGGVVEFRPVRGGEWAILTDRAIDLRLFDASDEPLPRLLRDTQVECSGLGEAHVYSFEALVAYRVLLPPQDNGRVGLVIEHLPDFTPLMIRDEDGDGSGLARADDDFRAMACAPPDGWALYGTGMGHDDCDDGDSEVFPGAEEICDGVDNNCSGGIDDVSEGACSSASADLGDSTRNDSNAVADTGEGQQAGARQQPEPAEWRDQEGLVTERTGGCSTGAALGQSGNFGNGAWWTLALLSSLAWRRRRALGALVLILGALGCGTGDETRPLDLAVQEGRAVPASSEAQTASAGMERGGMRGTVAESEGKPARPAETAGSGSPPSQRPEGDMGSGPLRITGGGQALGEAPLASEPPSASDAGASDAQPPPGCATLAEGASCAEAQGHCVAGRCLQHYTEGHADLSIRLSPAGTELQAHFVTSGLPQARVGGELLAEGTELALDEVAIVITDKFFERPAALQAFAPLCVAAGQSVSWLSQGNDSRNGQPFLGFEVAAAPEALAEGGITVRLLGVEGPGEHSLWKDGFPPNFLFSSCDGVGPEDELFLPVGHDHFNLGFSGDLGQYRLTYEAAATLAGAAEADEPLTHTFVVHYLTR